MAGKCGHYHESSDCFEYPKKSSLLKSSHPNFPTQKYPGVENFKPKIILWSFKIRSAHPGGKEVKKEGKEKKKRLPSHSVHASCPNFLDELPRKHLLHTRDIVPLLVEGANFCFLIFWTFVGSPPALTQKKDRGMFLLYSTRPSLPLATIMEVWRSPFFRGERAWTDQRFFFLQSICSVNNRHLRTTNGSTLTLYLSFKG